MTKESLSFSARTRASFNSSSGCPTSTVTAITSSYPKCSLSSGIQTEVSSPPEYASTTFFICSLSYHLLLLLNLFIVCISKMLIPLNHRKQNDGCETKFPLKFLGKNYCEDFLLSVECTSGVHPRA